MRIKTSFVIISLGVTLAHAQISRIDLDQAWSIQSVTNPTSHLAFFVHLTMCEDIKPIYWDDNYFSLMPGEKREITAAYQGSVTQTSAANRGAGSRCDVVADCELVAAFRGRSQWRVCAAN